jgi:hypothetical protein
MRKNVVASRLGACRRILRLNTRRIRLELLAKLGDIFNEAHALAQDRGLALREREKWARVAAYAAQTIDGLCSKFDAQQVDTDLAELERLINEARAKAKAANIQAGTPVDRRDSNSPGPS